MVTKRKDKITKSDKIKMGRWTKIEHQFLYDNVERLTTEEIAEYLSRPIESVEENKKALGARKSVNDLKLAFKDSHKWMQLEKELTESEMTYFAQQYADFVHQFQDDIFATEETQIFMAIKLEILQQRIGEERKRADIDAVTTRELYEAFKATAGNSKEDLDKALEFERLIKQIESSNTGRTRDYLAIQGEYNKLMTNLKATRDQRVDTFEKTSVSYIDVLKKVQDKKYRNEMGKELAMFKKGTDKHKATVLKKDYQFADGEIETPMIKADET